MLIDPTTGQHYILPAAQPQLAYYPVFYNPAQPPPPIYTQSAYLVASSLQSATPIAPARPILIHANSQFRPPMQSVPASYHVETPSISSASVCGENQSESFANYFQRTQETRNSMESAGSSASASFSNNKHSDGKFC